MSLPLPWPMRRQRPCRCHGRCGAESPAVAMADLVPESLGCRDQRTRWLDWPGRELGQTVFGRCDGRCSGKPKPRPRKRAGRGIRFGRNRDRGDAGRPTLFRNRYAAGPGFESGGVDTGSAARDGPALLRIPGNSLAARRSGPGATQWGPGQNIDVFLAWYRTITLSTSGFRHRYLVARRGSRGTLASEPAATSRTTNMRDVFWRGTDNHLKHRCYSYSDGWSLEQDLGGALASSPAAASWGALALHVFWQGSDGNLKHKSMDYATDIWTDRDRSRHSRAVRIQPRCIETMA